MAAESGPSIDPIDQFSLHPVVPISIAGHDFSLTNSGLFMLLAVALSCLIAAIGARGGSGVPGRMQSLAEMAYEFIAGMVRSAAGEGGMRFFPFVFSIFFFILICNLLGFLPYSFTVTSQIVITAALALLVFLQPSSSSGSRSTASASSSSSSRSGVPIYILPLVVAIEIDFVPVAPAQPLGASLRQHARRAHHALCVRRLRRHAARRGRRH